MPYIGSSQISLLLFRNFLQLKITFIFPEIGRSFTCTRTDFKPIFLADHPICSIVASSVNVGLKLSFGESSLMILHNHY